jgi:hypothetical protein
MGTPINGTPRDRQKQPFRANAAVKTAAAPVFYHADIVS